MGRAGLERRAVVEAAAQLADERGFDGFNLGQLAERLGVRTPSLYNHVAGQADLERELSLEAARELYARFARATVGRAGDQAVRALAAAYRTFARERPGLYPALAIAPAPGDSEAHESAAALVELLVAVVAGYGLSGNDAIHAVRGLRAALHGFLSLEASGGFGLPLDLDESYARLVEALAAGLRARKR